MRAFVFFSRKLKGETENNCADLLILIYSAKTFKDSLEKLIEISGTLADYGSLMKERLLEITMEGLPENWDGVYEAKTK